MVFFFRNSRLDRTVAVYPGPAGATESELPLQAWDEVVAANPALATMEPDVEAVLVRSVRGLTATCSSAISYPSTGATSSSASCAGPGGVRRWARGPRAAAALLDDVRARSRPAPAAPSAARDDRPRLRRPGPAARALRRRPDPAGPRPADPAEGAAVHAVVLRAQIRIDAQRRATRTPRRPGCSTSSARRNGGARPSAPSSGPTPPPLCRGSPAAPRSTCRCPARTTSRSQAPSTCTRSPTGWSRWRSCSPARSSAGRRWTAARLFGVTQIPWHRDAAYRMPVQVWRELMAQHFPNTGWLRVDTRTLGQLQSVQEPARPADVGRGLRCAAQGGGVEPE
jgi:hypothetical protein